MLILHGDPPWLPEVLACHFLITLLALNDIQQCAQAVEFFLSVILESLVNELPVVLNPNITLADFVNK